MRDYWKNLYDTVSRTPGASLLAQVGKTLQGQALPDDQVDLIARSAAQALALSSQDVLVDLCCGNGVITERLAPSVREVLAVDFSQGLIEVARAHSKATNVAYAHADVLGLGPQYFSGRKKVLMNESLQHFVESDLGALLDSMTTLGEGSLVFFGGIPEIEKLYVYYDTPEKRAFYESRESEGRPHMGKWWSRDAILQLASGRGFKASALSQAPSMVTAYYRFDVLLEKRA